MLIAILAIGGAETVASEHFKGRQGGTYTADRRHIEISARGGVLCIGTMRDI